MARLTDTERERLTALIREGKPLPVGYRAKLFPDGETFRLGKVFWRDTVLDKKKHQAELRIPQDEFTGRCLMLIYFDKYGNELKAVKTPADFVEKAG